MTGADEPLDPQTVIEQWLEPSGFSPADVPESPAWFADHEAVWKAGFREIPSRHKVLPVALAVWIRRHSAAHVLPYPLAGPVEKLRYCGRFHPYEFADNAKTDRRITTTWLGTDDLRQQYPCRSVDEVCDAWHAPLTTDVPETMKPLWVFTRESALREVSWGELLAAAIAFWVQRHPYALFLPVPLPDATKTSRYHPQSWCVNADSPFLDRPLLDISGEVPARITELPPHLQHAARPPRKDAAAETDTQDPFAEFR